MGPTTWVNPVNWWSEFLYRHEKSKQSYSERERETSKGDDLIVDLNSSNVFSKSDTSSVYHQLVLKKTCWYITTFTTHAGLEVIMWCQYNIKNLPECNSRSTKRHSWSKEFLWWYYSSQEKPHNNSLRATFKHLQESWAKLNNDVSWVYCWPCFHSRMKVFTANPL